MPIIKSAKKALRSSGRKRVFNLRRKETMRRTVKEVEKLAGEGKHVDANSKLALAYQAIDKAAKRGVIKKIPQPVKNLALLAFLEPIQSLMSS